MRQRNDESVKGELQIRFTSYLVQAVRRRQRDYMTALHHRRDREYITDTVRMASPPLEQAVIERLPLWEKIGSDALLHAMKRLNERERYVFLSRVLDQCSFDTLGAKLGLSYKGAAAVYYRAVQKLKRDIERGKQRDI